MSLLGAGNNEKGMSSNPSSAPCYVDWDSSLKLSEPQFVICKNGKKTIYLRVLCKTVCTQ